MLGHLPNSPVGVVILTTTSRIPGWRYVAKIFVLLAFFAICAWWGVIVLGPENFLFSGAFLYVPFWITLTPLFLTSGVAWLLGWRWRLIALVTLLVFLWPIMGFNFGQPDSGFSPIRLMTYNVKAYLVASEIGGFDDVISEIHRHDPDILMLQDAKSLHAEDAPDSPTVKAIVGSRSVFAFGQYLVASRFPLRRCNVGSISYDEHSHTLVHCIVSAHGQDIDLYTAHFISPRDGLNAFRWEGIMGYSEWEANVQARMIQAGKLAQLVAKKTRPIIVAGDLNAPEQSLVVRTLLDTGLRDAFSSAGWGYGFTHGHSLKPHLFSTIRIDHILASREIGIADCFVGGKEGSEHRPVIADLWIY